MMLSQLFKGYHPLKYNYHNTVRYVLSSSSSINSIHQHQNNRQHYCSTTNNNIDNNNSSNNNNNNSNNIDNSNVELSSKERNILKRKKKKDDLLNNLTNELNNSNNNTTSKVDQRNKQIDEQLNRMEHVKLDRCTGCGCTMQYEDTNTLGYIPKSVAIRYMLNKQVREDFIKEEEEMILKLKEQEENQLEQQQDYDPYLNQFNELEEEVVDNNNNNNNILEHQEEEEMMGELDDLDQYGNKKTKIDKGQIYFERFFGRSKLNSSSSDTTTATTATLDTFLKKEVCQRCHMLKNYGKVVPIKIPVNEFKSKLANIRNMNCVVIKVVDIMDFSGTFIEDFRHIVGNNPVIVVCNKMDVLPADIHKHRIEDWIRRECKARGMVAAHVKLLSSASKEGITDFIVELEKIRRGRDVFVVGCSNVGKSTFLNALVDEYSNKVEFGDQQEEENGGKKKKNGKQEVKHKEAEPQETPEKEAERKRKLLASRVTTSIFPGTTLNVISVPLWNNSTLFDTPGVDNPSQIIKLLKPEELKAVIPTKRIKPSLVHMIEGKSLFLAGLARIDYSGGLATFTVYTNNNLPLHLCRTDKADALFQRQRGKMLCPPIGLENININNNNNNNYIESDIIGNGLVFDEKMDLSQLTKFSITPEQVDFKHTHTDLVISGLGWIAIKPLSKQAKPFKLSIYTPKFIDVSLRAPLVPFTDTFNIVK
ncbi:hypothetical protein DFA_09413 [Cavenderia fasciculata]|uniref:G domain-containing protein n=1 Tax=Cavenderia fasciculata TaxID=261658 RepID=F4Q7K0_CACFS|nr:uncharacterized protein DFA_09413 [Cavenderia fasciculata]EGG16382.1 hypothetical protein DFA_09413 [Cavenderia fasciculata]|eukprot:XP_004354766.1 hypothetical protein DFA_09413 [Cavenderia fasciculata]